MQLTNSIYIDNNDKMMFCEEQTIESSFLHKSDLETPECCHDNISIFAQSCSVTITQSVHTKEVQFI